VTINEPVTTSTTTETNNNDVINTTATISIEPSAGQAESQTQIAVSSLESSARVGANASTTNTSSDANNNPSRRGGMGWGDITIDEGTTWGRSSNNNTLFGGSSNTQRYYIFFTYISLNNYNRPSDPRSTVLRSTTANSTTASISANDSVNLGGSAGTTLPQTAQAVVDNNAISNVGDSNDFAASNISTQLSSCFSVSFFLLLII
jgi:hypothetical protein